MKREYMKPTMNVVELQHQHQLLAGSITDVNKKSTGWLGVRLPRQPQRRKFR